MTPAASALERLYRDHGHSVLRRARGLLGSDSEGEEMLHEVFLKLLEDPAQLAHLQNPLAWLYSVTTNACFNRIRNRKTRQKILSAQRPAEELHDAGLERRLTLDGLLSALPDEAAAALVYYHMDQMTHAEIAEMLGCSRRHVGNLLERATAQLAHSEHSHLPSDDPSRERRS